MTKVKLSYPCFLICSLLLSGICLSQKHVKGKSPQKIEKPQNVRDTVYRRDTLYLPEQSDEVSKEKSHGTDIGKELSVDLFGHFFWWLIGLIIGFFFLRIRNRIINWRYKRIFGQDIKSYSIVYPNFTLQTVYDATGHLLQFPYAKGGGFFRMTSPISLADMRAAQYLSQAFYKRTSRSPEIIPDTSVTARLDFSYCSVGGTGNDKTNDILTSPNNLFFDFLLTPTTQGIQRLNAAILHQGTGNFDIGLILRVTSHNFPNRIHICAAGLGEWGTSGAAWYLATRWRDLLEQSKGKDFGAVVRVRNGIDESAELIDFRT
jgi:hypothetical protein